MPSTPGTVATQAPAARFAALNRLRPVQSSRATGSQATRVLIADGQGLVRAGYRLLLEADRHITVVGEAATGEQAVALAGHTRPDVVLIDARLPGLDSVAVTDPIAAGSGPAGEL